MTAPRAAKVCPREPTQAMIDAGDEHNDFSATDDVVLIWRAMYDAAPSAAPSDDVLVEWLRKTHCDTCDTRLLPDQGYACTCGHSAAADRIESLAAELAQAREDARRYRWLRDRLHAIDYEYGEPHVPVLVFEYPQGQAVGPGRALDAAIDAALAEQEGK